MRGKTLYWDRELLRQARAFLSGHSRLRRTREYSNREVSDQWLANHDERLILVRRRLALLRCMECGNWRRQHRRLRPRPAPFENLDQIPI
jgi:hypothetical protein